MEENYRKIKKVNQSTLKKILVSPQAYIRARDKVDEEGVTPEHFVFGRMVDDMLLNPSEIDNLYYVMDDVGTSNAIKEIIRNVYDFAKLENDITLIVDPKLEDAILNACEMYNYQPRYKPETKISKIQELGGIYFNSLNNAGKKTIVSKEDYNSATICVAALKTDKYISKYFSKAKEVENLDRFIVEFELKGIPCKGELDRMHINHSEKIIRPIDFKYTGKSVLGFKFDFWKYRYDFQGAFYTMGILRNDKIKALVLEGYKLLPFQYIVVEKDMNNLPMIFEFTDSIITMGKLGGTFPNGKVIEGISQALEKYVYHNKTDNWDYSKEYIDSGGKIMLTL